MSCHAPDAVVADRKSLHNLRKFRKTVRAAHATDPKPNNPDFLAKIKHTFRQMVLDLLA